MVSLSDGNESFDENEDMYNSECDSDNNGSIDVDDLDYYNEVEKYNYSYNIEDSLSGESDGLEEIIYEKNNMLVDGYDNKEITSESSSDDEPSDTEKYFYYDVNNNNNKENQNGSFMEFENSLKDNNDKINHKIEEKSIFAYTDEEFMKILLDSKLTKENIIEIMERIRPILASEPNLLILNGEYTLVGDIHGQFYDLLNLFQINDETFGTDKTILQHNTDTEDTNKAIYTYTPTNRRFIFLGDYVDRGTNSIEVLMLLLYFKCKYPDFYLLRGNHESKLLTRNYGFKDECIFRYDISIWWYLCEIFKYLPVAATVNNHFFVVHGGISKKYINDINSINNESRINITNFLDLLWSDPYEGNEKNIPDFIFNNRGAGHLFSEDGLNRFLENNKLKEVVRSHQLVEKGFLSMFNNKLHKLWSAPYYCKLIPNKAAIMKIRGNKYEIKIFDSVDTYEFE
ncbi:Ser/Thr protein phosphatase family protein [Spraguea lophii 42_110]|uniref:Serine/threonine-protein phosphatase n=1 Tax=Spraguea lophii (strain 42_110) TaxID=1358809 RepID=S7W957_SPRLO|nr:Ser/Thr protein phosphatase family protein [Spraguea lophii 42_110]